MLGNVMVASMDALQVQRAYIEGMYAARFDYGLTIADAFVRGMRDIGYKSTGSALDELIDNAIQASAQRVDVVTLPLRDARGIDQIAILDDGHGMDPEMIRLAVTWGGSHREGDRSGFGRYGYGLPTAAISVGRRYTVYSRPSGGSLYALTIDIDDVADGHYTDCQTGKITVPLARFAVLPAWIRSYLSTNRRRFGHGTVIILEHLDRTFPKTRAALRESLVTHFGVVYRNYLDNVRVTVDENVVAPIDPLFLTPGACFFDEDADRAIALAPRAFAVKDSMNGRPLGTVRMRASVMPPTFGSVDKRKPATLRNQNHRFPILKAHNGLVVLRNGRQIDVVSRGLETTFVNNDRYWKVELDFDAALDEFFAVTTAKQQVVPSDFIHAYLKDEGLYTMIGELRQRYKMQAMIPRPESAASEIPRRSEVAMTKLAATLPTHPTVPTERDGQLRLEDAHRCAAPNHQLVDEVHARLTSELAARPYRVVAGTLPGAPLFRVERIGAQTTLHLNIAHRFYRDVYAAPDSTPRVRSALEVFLLIIGERELAVTADCAHFYRQERHAWSERLEMALLGLKALEHGDDLRNEIETLPPTT